MANWSSDTFYFGKALPDSCYIEHQMHILKLMRFDAHDGPYVISAIDLCGSAVRIGGSGKWGCGIPIPEDVWNLLNQDIVVWTGASGFDSDVGMTIRIAGEDVLSEDRKIWDDTPFTRYMGRNADEEAFFKKLWLTHDREREERRVCEAFALLQVDEQTRLKAAVDAQYREQAEEGWRRYNEAQRKLAQPGEAIQEPRQEAKHASAASSIIEQLRERARARARRKEGV